MADRLFIFKVINIVVLAAAVISSLPFSIRAQRQFAENTFYIAPIINDNRYFFNLGDTEKMREEVGADRVAVKTVGTGAISAWNMTAFSRVIYTNSEYFELGNVTFMSGGGWRGNMESENVAVVNEVLAWQLFGSLDVVDMDIYISGERYAIIGVIQHGNISQAAPTAYIPLNPAYGDLVISSIYAQFGDYSFLTVQNAINDFLLETGRNAGDYHVLSICRYVENIGLKPSILIFLVGIYALVTIVINCISYARTLRENRVKLFNMKTLLKLTALLVLLIAGVVVLILTITFDFWIPHGDGSRFNDIVTTITNSGFLPADEYLSDGLQSLTNLNTLTYIALIAGCVALVNFIFAHKVKNDMRRSSYDDWRDEHLINEYDLDP